MHEHSSILVVVVNSTAYLYPLHILVVDALVVVRELYYELNLYRALRGYSGAFCSLHGILHGVNGRNVAFLGFFR